MALVLATDLRSESLSRLNVSDLAEDGSAVAIGDCAHRLTIPTHARSLLRALVIERRIAGAGGDGALFIDPKTGERRSAERMRKLIGQLAWTTAAPMGRLKPERPSLSPAHWLIERRIKVGSLQPQDVLGG